MALRIPSWVKVLGVFAMLFLFLVSIGLMEHLFKLMGRGFAEEMIRTTASPIVGLCIGILATSLVQSSSLTTSLVVGMVAAGALTVPNSIPIVMGANIGTSVTNLLVSLGHIRRENEFRRAFAAATVHDLFNLMAVLVLFPLQLMTGFLSDASTAMAAVFHNVGGIAYTSPVKALVKPAVGAIAGVVGEYPVPLLIIAVALLFTSLKYLTVLIRTVVMSRLEALFDEHIFKTALRAGIFGLALTALVQSSSIATSLVVPLAGAGLLTLPQILPYTLGSNVGTTVTALLASLVTGQVSAVAVAFAHLCFNICGILLIWPIAAVRRAPIVLSERLSAAAVRNWIIPFAYIGTIFFAVPVLVIFVL